MVFGAETIKALPCQLRAEVISQAPTSPLYAWEDAAIAMVP